MRVCVRESESERERARGPGGGGGDSPPVFSHGIRFIFGFLFAVLGAMIVPCEVLECRGQGMGYRV